MEFRRLGRSGLSVSALSYGNWLNHGASVNDERAVACVHAALDAGITTLDTADAYADTAAETVLGNALRGYRRESVEICTKVYYPTGPGANDRGLGRKHIIESAHASLRRLGTDYIDVYQAHRFDRTVPLEETMLAFADLVRRGTILYVGTSEWTSEQLTRGAALARELHVPLISNQAQYSMLWRVPEQQVMPTSQREGIGQFVWSPLAQGVLTGKYQPGTTPPAGSRATYSQAVEGRGAGFFRGFLRDEVLERVELLRPLAADSGLGMAQLALAWVLRNPAVSTAIVGATRPEQIAENAKAVGVVLGDDLTTRIDEVLNGVIEADPALDQTP